MNFIEKLENFIQEKKLLAPRDKVLVGFSGGADSTALLLALSHLRTQYKLSLLAVHINYHLRSAESDADEQFVKDFCFRRNISLVVKNVELSAQANLENQARDIRFDYFRQLAASYSLNKIAVGHNQQDQAETMIFRIFRGSGYTGLKGILPRDGNLIHPLLPFSRAEITQWLQQEEIAWCEDSSNQENSFTRNKIRNELLPWLSANLNPNFIEKLGISANIFAETDEILAELSKRRYKKLVTQSNENSLELALPKLKKIKATLRFYIYRQAYADLAGSSKDFYYSNFEEIENILDAEGAKLVMLPEEILVLKEYETLTFCFREVLDEVDVNNSKKISSLRHRFLFEDYRISMKHLKILPDKRYLYEDKNTIYLDLDKTSFPLIIRHRQPGDRFVPLGMKHSKKLKDFFIDEKVSRFERDKVLLFCDSDKILWVAGMRIHNDVAISQATANILRIKLEKLSKKNLRQAERIK
ncbi:MAG: tRNA lysidine(34) synthetase TilS [Candidatus Cloacimonadales bacterium]